MHGGVVIRGSSSVLVRREAAVNKVRRHVGAADLSSCQFFAIAATTGEKMVEVEVEMHAANRSANEPKDTSGQHLLMDRSINKDVSAETQRQAVWWQRSTATTSSTATPPRSGTSGKNGGRQ
jgi:hypothetical protein